MINECTHVSSGQRYYELCCRLPFVSKLDVPSLATAGVIYAIILGVKLARAESADQQQEAKKRLVNFIIGLVAVIALILLMKLVCTYLPEWVPSLYIDTSTGN